MNLRFLYPVIVLAGFLTLETGCNNPVEVEAGDNPAVPAGVTKIFSDGFGNDLSSWDDHYMIVVGDNYPHMQVTTGAAHTGTYSVTADSNRTALQYSMDYTTRVQDGVVGVQCYMMAEELGGINFTVEIGKNAGSSGGLGKSFGIGFDPSDSVKCKFYDMLGDVTVSDTILGPIQLNHWYKFVVEVDFTTRKVTYSIDDAVVVVKDLPSSDMAHIDRLLVFRGEYVERPNYVTINCLKGPKPYYVDDIVLYKK
jgi:hypothetical protein